MFIKKLNFYRLAAVLGIGLAAAAWGESAHAADCSYVVTNDWGTGFTAAIRITNTGSTAINSWDVSWHYTDGTIRTGGWNANFSGSNPYSATSLSWNSTISPGSTIEFGIQGNNGARTAQSPTVTGSVCGNESASGSNDSSSSSGSSSSSSSSSSGGSCISKCNWYGALYPTCQSQADGWGWENTQSCIGENTCNSQYGNGGIVGCSSNNSGSSGSSGSSGNPSSSAGSTGLLKGVSLASAEFGESNLPGVYGKDYYYPNQTEVDYFKSKNMNIMRLPFRWERLQPTMNQDFDSLEFERLNQFVTEAAAKNMYVLLDPHNYARYYGNIIGSSQVPNSAFADFWGRLANVFKDNPYVVFGLMNEPNTMPTEQWVSAANAAAVAIRNTGAKNLILVPGNAWTGAHSWDQSWYGTSNATALLDFVDPGNNFAVEVHQYFDSDYSGTHSQCALTDATQVLSGFTSWLASNNLRGFLGELGGGNNSNCQQAIKSALQYIENNRKYWTGWSWWAAGPWWTWEDNFLVIEPTADGRDAPQLSWMEPYLP